MLPRLFVSFGNTISVVLQVEAETGLEEGEEAIYVEKRNFIGPI